MSRHPILIFVLGVGVGVVATYLIWVLWVTSEMGKIS